MLPGNPNRKLRHTLLYSSQDCRKRSLPIERSIVNREVMNDASLCRLPGNPNHKRRHTLAMLRDITSMFREAYMETAYLGIVVVNCNLQRLLCGWYGLEHGEGIDCWYGSHG